MTEPTVPRRRIIIKGLAVGVINALVWAVWPLLLRIADLPPFLHMVQCLVLLTGIWLSCRIFCWQGLRKWGWSYGISAVFALLICAPFTFFHSAYSGITFVLIPKLLTIPILYLLRKRERKYKTGITATGEITGSPATEGEPKDPLARPFYKGLLVGGLVAFIDVAAFIMLRSPKADYDLAMGILVFPPIPVVILCVWLLCRRAIDNWKKSFGVAILCFASFFLLSFFLAVDIVGGPAIAFWIFFIWNFYELVAILVGTFLVWLVKAGR